MFENKIRVKLAEGYECFSDASIGQSVSKNDTDGKMMFITPSVMKALKEKILIRLS